jgi:hypothetical protein
MTTAYERTRALVFAGELLESLRTADSAEVSASFRDQANQILRHYPSNMEIGWIADASQRWETMMPLLDSKAVPLEIRKGYRW